MKERLVVIALQKHSLKAWKALQQTIDELARLESAIDVVAQKNQCSFARRRSARGRFDLQQQALEQVQTAMGVANRTILRMVLLQAMIVAGIGYAIGIGLCAGFFEITSRVSINLRGFELPWQVAAGTAGAVFIIIVIASLASVRRVMVVDPAIVFRG